MLECGCFGHGKVLFISAPCQPPLPDLSAASMQRAFEHAQADGWKLANRQAFNNGGWALRQQLDGWRLGPRILRQVLGRLAHPPAREVLAGDSRLGRLFSRPQKPGDVLWRTSRKGLGSATASDPQVWTSEED